jgi:hypothetical protein
LVRKTIASNPSLLLRLLLPQPGFFLSPNLKLPRPLRHDFQQTTRLSPYSKSSPNQQRERRGEERRQNHSQASNQGRKTGKEETEEATTTLPSRKQTPKKKKKNHRKMGKKKQRKMKETVEEHGFDKKKKLLLLLLLLTFEMFWLFLRDNCSSRDKRKARTQNPQRTQRYCSSALVFYRRNFIFDFFYFWRKSMDSGRFQWPNLRKTVKIATSLIPSWFFSVSGFVARFSRLNLPRNYRHFYYIFLWMIATSASFIK